MTFLPHSAVALAALLTLLPSLLGQEESAMPTSPPLTIGAYYYPWYHAAETGDTGWMKKALRGRLHPQQLPKAGVYGSRVRDGLPDTLPTELALLTGDSLEAAALNTTLDQAWLTYVKDRPLSSRVYLDNPHGGWMRGVERQMLEEDTTLRQRARTEFLSAPGQRLIHPSP